MSAAGELFVDFDELGKIQRELTTLIGALSELGSHALARPTGDEIGSADVAQAVSHFEDSWRRGRDDLIANLRACQLNVEKALEAYTTTETTLEDAMGRTAETTA